MVGDGDDCCGQHRNSVVDSPTVIAVLTPSQSQLQEFETNPTVSNGPRSILPTVRR